MLNQRPNLGWFSDLRGRLRVELEDVSESYGKAAAVGEIGAAAVN